MLAIAAVAAAPALAEDFKIGVVVKIGGIPWFNAMEAGITAARRRSSATRPS